MKSLGYSIAIHFAVILTGLVYLKSAPFEEPQRSANVWVEIESTPATGSKALTNGKKNAGLALGLSPRSRPKNFRGQTFQPGESLDQGEVLSGVDGYEVARRMKVKTDTRLTPFLQALWQKISDHVYYPESFAYFSYSGEVVLQFEVDQFGSLISPIEVTASQNANLEALARVTVSHALGRERPIEVTSPKAKLRLVAVFNYEAVQPGAYQMVKTNASLSAPIQRNVLTFHKVVSVDPSGLGQEGETFNLLGVIKKVKDRFDTGFDDRRKEAEMRERKGRAVRPSR